MTNETAKQTIARLNAWKELKEGRTVNINWRWKGRDRSGIVSLMENAEPIIECLFQRGTQTWTEQDRDFTSCHTGSSKHLALMDVANAIGV